MIDPDGLNVWSGQQLVGYLWRNTQGQLGFRYHEQWLQQGEFAISFTLPLQDEEFAPEANLAHRFFANLLPEGGARSQIVRDLKISNTDFDLLRAIGGECAGALSILQAEYSPVQESAYHSSTTTHRTDCNPPVSPCSGTEYLKTRRNLPLQHHKGQCHIPLITNGEVNTLNTQLSSQFRSLAG
jgi:HipA-like protein